MTEFSQKYMLDYLLLELDYVQGTIGIEYGQLLDEKTDNEHTQIRKKSWIVSQTEFISPLHFHTHSLFLNSNTYQFYIPGI